MFTRYIAVPSRQSVEPFCAAVCPAIGVPISLTAGWQIQRGPWEKLYSIKKISGKRIFFCNHHRNNFELIMLQTFQFLTYSRTAGICVLLIAPYNSREIITNVNG